MFLFPSVAPDLADGENLFREDCTACHGERETGNVSASSRRAGPAADTLNPQPRDFTAPERLNVCTPLQFYQAVTFGVEGTAMAAFAEAFTPEQRWNLAFYLKFERTHTEYHWCLEEKGSPERARALVRDMLEILRQIRGRRGLRKS
jgi:high-affinity iron transporter